MTFRTLMQFLVALSLLVADDKWGGVSEAMAETECVSFAPKGQAKPGDYNCYEVGKPLIRANTPQSIGGYSGGSGNNLNTTINNLNTINATGNSMIQSLNQGAAASAAAVERADERVRQMRQADEERNRQAGKQAQQLLNAAAANPNLDPWANPPKKDSDNSTGQTHNCDCTRIVGNCTAGIRITPTQGGAKGSYGAILNITSNTERCAKVSYYVDSTPYFNVLSQGSTTTDSVWGQHPVTNETISGVSCQICAAAR